MSQAGTICHSDGKLSFKKRPSADGSMCHTFGDMVVAKETPLNLLLGKYGFLRDGLHSYIGYFTHKIALFDSNGTVYGERMDLLDVIAEDVENLVVGEQYKISVTKWSKEARFMRYEAGPFYKWQTRNGFMFILMQEEVDTLTEKEKAQLKI